MARKAFFTIGLTCRVLGMTCKALAVTGIVVGALGWNRLVAISTSGPREGMRLVARLTLVAMSTRLDGGNLRLVTIDTALPPACPGWSRFFVGMMAESALMRSPFGGSCFGGVAIVAAFDIRDLMVLVTIDARPGMC